MLKLGVTYLSLLGILHTGQKEGDGLLLGRIDRSHCGMVMRLGWTLLDVVRYATVQVE